MCAVLQVYELLTEIFPKSVLDIPCPNPGNSVIPPAENLHFLIFREQIGLKLLNSPVPS